MKKLFIISACIFLASCSNEVASSNYQHETNNTSTTIPLSDALIALDDMMSSLAACTKSENTQDYSMEDILSFGLPQIPQTKAGITEEDTHGLLKGNGMDISIATGDGTGNGTGITPSTITFR